MFDEKLAARVRAYLAPQRNLREMGMFGGLCFLVEGKMAAGILGDRLIARVEPEDQGALLRRRGVESFAFTGRPMTGVLVVSPGSLRTGKALAEWLDRSLARARRSQPTKRKARVRAWRVP